MTKELPPPPSSAEMRYAADVLERWGKHHGLIYPDKGQWSAGLLRNEADVIDDAAEALVTIDTDDMTRYDELAEYARRHDYSLSVAVVHLVNTGLSHYPDSGRPPLTERI